MIKGSVFTVFEPSNSILNIDENGIYDTTTFKNIDVDVFSAVSKYDIKTYIEKTESVVKAGCSYIGNYAFYYHPSLTEAYFPNCVSIGSFAFSSCYNLSTVSFPNCTDIEGSVFYSCTRLISASFPNCERIGQSAFYGCRSLTTASFPKCETVENRAFQYCYSLSTVSFPECTYIGTDAFANCSSLTTVYFPKCSLISGEGFYSCSALTTAYFPECKTISSWAFYSCTALSVASFPNCTIIKSSAFFNCSNLTSFYLTGSSLVDLYGVSVFYNTPLSNPAYLGYYGSIYALPSLISAYKVEFAWSVYSDRFVPYSDDPVVGEKTITYNGEFIAPNDNLDGYSKVIAERAPGEHTVATDITNGYVNGSTFVKGSGYYSDVYEVKNKHKYRIEPGNSFDNLFKALFTTTNTATATSNISGTAITDQVPLSTTVVTWTATSNGYVTITKSNSASGYTTCLFDITLQEDL